MTGRRGAAPVGGWRWRPTASEGVGTVQLRAPFGGRFWVDLVEPGRVIAFQAYTARALDGLAVVFGPSWRAAIDDGTPRVSESEAWTPPPLPEGWQRLAVVESVRQWMPDALDESALVIDEATAWDAAGERGQAAMAIALVTGTLVQLCETAVSGGLPSSTLQNLARATDLALRSVKPDDEDLLTLTRLRPMLDRAPGAGSPAQHSWVPADELVRTRLSSDPVQALDSRADLGAVSARLIEWRGPLHPDVSARRDSEGSVHISVRLDEDAEAEDFEARDLIGYLADAYTGTILSQAMLNPGDDSRRLTCVVPAEDRQPSGLVVGVFEGQSPRPPRTTPLGYALSQLDRALIGYWALARRSAAGVAHSIEGRWLVAALRARLTALQSRFVGDVAAQTAARLARRRIDLLERQLHALPAGPATRPLLVEQIAYRGMTADDQDATMRASTDAGIGWLQDELAWTVQRGPRNADTAIAILSSPALLAWLKAKWCDACPLPEALDSSVPSSDESPESRALSEMRRAVLAEHVAACAACGQHVRVLDDEVANFEDRVLIFLVSLGRSDVVASSHRSAEAERGDQREFREGGAPAAMESRQFMFNDELYEQFTGSKRGKYQAPIITLSFGARQGDPATVAISLRRLDPSIKRVTVHLIGPEGDVGSPIQLAWRQGSFPPQGELTGSFGTPAAATIDQLSARIEVEHHG